MRRATSPSVGPRELSQPRLRTCIVGIERQQNSSCRIEQGAGAARCARFVRWRYVRKALIAAAGTVLIQPPRSYGHTERTDDSLQGACGVRRGAASCRRHRRDRVHRFHQSSRVRVAASFDAPIRRAVPRAKQGCMQQTTRPGSPPDRLVGAASLQDV